MKCQYYLAPTLDITHHVSDDLHSLGVGDWYIHVLSKDEAGLKREKIHSSNYIEKSDAFAGALAGAVIGLILGALAALVLSVSSFGQGLSVFVYALVVIAPSGFGLWEGALLRAKYESTKTALFHDDMEAGKYLFLVYTPKEKEEAVKKMMQEKHPAAEHVAVDGHFMDPFSRPEST